MTIAVFQRKTWKNMLRVFMRKKPHKCSYHKSCLKNHIESVHEGRKSRSMKSPRDEKAVFKETFWSICNFAVFYVEGLVIMNSWLCLSELEILTQAFYNKSGTSWRGHPVIFSGYQNHFDTPNNLLFIFVPYTIIYTCKNLKNAHEMFSVKHNKEKIQFD